MRNITQDNKVVQRKEILFTHVLLYYELLAIDKKERAN